MVNFSQLFTLALAGSATAVHIDFKRYADHNCDAKHHIRKTSDLHATHCKSFSHHEIGFHSFTFDVTKHADDLWKKDCQIVVFPEKDCHGQGVTYGDMKDMNHVCAGLPIEGRSVRLECGKKKDPVVKTLKPMPQPHTKVVTHRPTHTVTETLERVPEETVTVVPKKKVKHCHYVDDDYREV